MAHVILEKAGENWRVVLGGRDGDRVGAATWDDLAFAAYSAIDFAGAMGAGTPELGAGVPPDALAQGEELRRIFASARSH